MANRFDQALTWGQRIQTAWSMLTSAWAKAIIYPTVSALLTGTSGYLGGIPLMWICMATALVFMAVTHAVLRLYEIQQWINPNNKLAYVQTVLNLDLKGGRPLAVVPGGSTGRARKLDQVQIGVELQNRSTFPLSVILQNAETSVDGKLPPRGTYPKPRVTIAPGHVFRMHDDPIAMNGVECGRLPGTMKFKIKYGLQGDEDCELLLGATLDISLTPSGQFEVMYTMWATAASPQGQATYGTV